MNTKELDEWGADFLQYCARFADVFGRKEPRAQATKYLRGLMASVPRKNSWQVAEVIGDRTPDATQRLLYKAKWSADTARDRLLQYVIEVFGEEDGIAVVDETGFIKRGTRSVGVKRRLLCGGTAQGTRSMRSGSNTVRKHDAACRWPRCTGSNVPPRTPINGDPRHPRRG